MKLACLLVLPLLAALAGCGGAEQGAEGERRTAVGEVLGGTISDDMLPLDTVTSQSPLLREKSGGDSRSAEGSGETTKAVDAAQPSPGPTPSEPAPATPAEPTPETEE